jgi:hypothetical protein
MMIYRDDPQKQANPAQQHRISVIKKRRRRRKMNIPHGPLAQGYASLDTGAPCVKEQSFAATAAATPERNLANQITGCTLRQKDTGPPKTPNPSTYAMKKTRALLPVRKPEGNSISSSEKRQSASSSDRAPIIMNCSADSATTKMDDALSDGIFMAALMSQWWG